MTPLDVALLHYPALNREGAVIATNIVTTEVHDISRACRTFGVRRQYIVHPRESQRAIAHRLLDKWAGAGSERLRTNRRRALGRCEVVESLNEAMERTESGTDVPCITVGTSAQPLEPSLSYSDMRTLLRTSERPVLLVFGTGWGIARAELPPFDHELAPIYGVDDYNHLSVRSAIAIILDRLRGEREFAGSG